ncbi:MAG: anti-sigma factor family protein [Planctomycetota bacterium]
MNRRPRMNCKTTRALFGDALDQRLPQSEALAVKEHILRCPECRARLERFQKLQNWTRALPSLPAARDFGARLMERIASGEGTPKAVLRSPVPLALRVKHFAYGAATAAALFLSAWLLMDGLEQLQGSSSSVPEEPLLSQVDQVGIANQAVRSVLSGLPSLQAEAPRIAGKYPPKKALAEIRERVEHIHDSAVFIRLVSPTLIELTKKMQSSLRSVELNLGRALRLAEDSDGSRDDLERLLDLIRIPALPEEPVRLRCEAPEVWSEIFLPAEPSRLRILNRFLEQVSGEHGHFLFLGEFHSGDERGLIRIDQR